MKFYAVFIFILNSDSISNHDYMLSHLFRNNINPLTIKNNSSHRQMNHYISIIYFIQYQTYAFVFILSFCSYFGSDSYQALFLCSLVIFVYKHLCFVVSQESCIVCFPVIGCITRLFFVHVFLINNYGLPTDNPTVPKLPSLLI